MMRKMRRFRYITRSNARGGEGRRERPIEEDAFFSNFIG
jgi:hypothetical protein